VVRKAAWAHSQALGLGLHDYQRLNRAMAIRRSEYDYLLPSVLGDALTLGTWLVASDGKLTMERRFQLIRNSDQATLLRAAGTWCASSWAAASRGACPRSSAASTCPP
jgi:Predicted thioesterase